MTVYTLSAAGINATSLTSATTPLQWVKLFPADTASKNWLVQTFGAPLVGTDQTGTYVYFAQGTQPSQSPANSSNLSSLTYDIAIPVGSSVELDPSVDWWVAYPLHDTPFVSGSSGALRPDQFVTIVATRHAGSLYGDSAGSVSGDSLSGPEGGAMVAWAVSNAVASGGWAPVTWTLSGDPGGYLYAVGGLSIPQAQGQLLVSNGGCYQIDANIRVTPNNTGNLYSALTFLPVANYPNFNPATQPKFVEKVIPASGANGYLPIISWRGYIPSNTFIQTVMFQDSGVALAPSQTDSTLSIRQVG